MLASTMPHDKHRLDQSVLDIRVLAASNGEHHPLLISAGAGTLLVQDWRNGHLGIQLQDAPADAPPPSANLVLHGDRAPFDHDPDADGMQSRPDALDNLIVKPNQIEADRVDTLYDGTGNDQLFGHGGNDSLHAWRGGDDNLDAGNGDDYLRAGAGQDILIGGEGLDRLLGQDGRDRLYAHLEQSDAQVIAAHKPDTEDTQGITEQGELLVGGNGDDWQVGHQRADLLLGGLGRDQLWGGAGDDVLYGDRDASTSQPTWTLQRFTELQPQTGYDIHHVFTTGINYLNADTARVGDDWLEGGTGDDVLVGDPGAGSSEGHGSDWLSGGAGNNTMDSAATLMSEFVGGQRIALLRCTGISLDAACRHRPHKRRVGMRVRRSRLRKGFPQFV